MIVVAGEALIDLVDVGGVLRAYPGGGPFNTAVALARFAVPVAFLGRLSRDRFGRLLAATLEEAGVDPRHLLFTDSPTPLAVVHEAEAEPEYSFYLAGTAYAELDGDELPAFAPDVQAFHLGTLALATDPPASALERLLEREAGRRLTFLDPNVRPAVVAGETAYRRRLESCLRSADVVKLSATDAAWLWPGADAAAVADSLVDGGAALAVVTLGAAGALARSRAGYARVSAPRVDVVDTVGAGDTFGAALLRRLWERGTLQAGAVAALGDAELEEALRFAAAAAALQCTSAGARPPSLAEIAAFTG